MGELEIKHLRLIRALAGTGNMTRAAETLFVTQSALSQQLKDIEGRLNVDLFFRTGKQMVLTAFGKKLLKTAEKVISTLEETELEIAKTVSGDSGELKVGTQCVFCYKWLPGVLSAFQEKFPNIEFELGTAVDLFQELSSGQYDLIISAGEKKDPRICFHPLFSDHMVCIMSHDHPFASKNHVRLADFEKTTLIMHSEKKANKFYQMALSPAGIEPGRCMTISQPQAIIEMVAAGFGVSMVPAWAVNRVLKEKKMTALPVGRGGMPVTWSAAYLRENTAVPAFRNEFINIVGRMSPSKK